MAGLMDGGEYRWLIVHERGYYLVDPHEGGVLYRDAIKISNGLDSAPWKCMNMVWAFKKTPT